MSVITRFNVYIHCNDLGGKVWNPAIRWTKKYAVFVILEDNQGNKGLGECWCFDSRPDALVAFLKTEIAPVIVGCDSDKLSAVGESLLSRATLTARHGMLASAWSGVDIAMWDLQSRSADLPLWQFIQRQHSQEISASINKPRLYGSAGLYGKGKTIHDLVAEMQSLERCGFNLVKMKVGGLTVQQDAERVVAVLNGLSETCELIIDGVYSYTVDDALALYRQLPAHRIHAFQSPVKASDLRGMQALCAAGVPVMGTEAEYRQELQSDLIHTGAVRYLQMAPIAVGGISRVLDLAAETRPDINLSLEVSSTAVALCVAWHLALASNKIAHVEYHFVHQVFFETLKINPKTFLGDESSSGCTFISRPGIGIQPVEPDIQPEFSLG